MQERLEQTDPRIANFAILNRTLQQFTRFSLIQLLGSPHHMRSVCFFTVPKVWLPSCWLDTCQTVVCRSCKAKFNVNICTCLVIFVLLTCGVVSPWLPGTLPSKLRKTVPRRLLPRLRTRTTRRSPQSSWRPRRTQRGHRWGCSNTRTIRWTCGAGFVDDGQSPRWSEIRPRTRACLRI